MIQIENLQKSFGNLKVLSDINIHIQDGEIYGLVGRSGAGKSTLLRCINGLESYQSGSLKVNETEVRELDKKQLCGFRKDIGMIFQHFPMLTRKTVYENIAFPMKCWKYSNTEIDKRVRELADIVGITEKLFQKPSTLSGGQKQRAAIARALSMNPQILLSDEATSALDPITTQSILDLLREINKKLGITIVIVTHQMEVVKAVCQKVSLLENGVITASGSVKELFLYEQEEISDFVGKKERITASSGVNLHIVVMEDDHSRKILSRLAKELQVEFAVLGGKMEQYGEENLGGFIINVEQNDAPKVQKFLCEEKIIWHECL